MGFKLAIFDWNGTLLDDLPIAYGSVLEIFGRYGIPPPSIDTYRAEITTRFMDFYRAHGIPKTATPYDLNAIRKEYFAIHGYQADLHVNAKETLMLCKVLGMQVAIVSAEIADVLEQRVRDFELTPFIDHIAGSAYDKEQALIAALDRFGVPAEEAFYLDDTFDGLMAARNVGIITFGFCGGYGTRDRIRAAKPDFPDIATHNDMGRILVRGGVR